MCKAFSCVVGRDKKVTWKFGTDSHEDLIKIAGYKDDTLDPEKIEFCRIEISPQNRSYLEPDEWIFKIDMDVTPAWWTLDHKKACEREHKKWLKRLNKILVHKAIIHPFRDITPPDEITEEHITLLQEWASVWDSVGDSVRSSVWDSVGSSVWDSVGSSVWGSVWGSVGSSVGDSVWDSVGDSVRSSVGDSVGSSVWGSVGSSVGDSVWAYIGSFFILERSAWEYTEKIDCKGYPFQSAVTFWELGLVPSFDGKKWRLHGGPEGKVLWEGEL
jgi:hypothetical protein